MKKIIILSLMLFSLIPAFCADSYSFTSAQEQAYLSKALTVFHNDYLSGVSIFDWDAYCGQQPISQKDFFKIAGRYDIYDQYLEAERLNAEKRKKGILLTAIGAVGSVAGMLMIEYSDYSGEGAFVGILSGVTFVFGGVMLLDTVKVEVSAYSARNIADNYNAQLAAKVSMQY